MYRLRSDRKRAGLSLGVKKKLKIIKFSVSDKRKRSSTEKPIQDLSLLMILFLWRLHRAMIIHT